MAVTRQICCLLITVMAIGLELNPSLGHGCPRSGSCTSEAREVHAHHQCDRSHDHRHHHHDYGVDNWEKKQLPGELAEEEDLKLLEFGGHRYGHDHVHYHGASEFVGVGLWIRAMGCSLLVSLASLICLILLPLMFVQGKPSKTIVDSLALFGAGAMLGDAFLHQLPHAFGGEHSHSHNHHPDDAHYHVGSGNDKSHSHSLNDLSVGISVLIGIILFLLVEKVVRYVEDRSGGGSTRSHGHHHYHPKKSENFKDEDVHNNSSKETMSQTDDSWNVEKQNGSSLLRKRSTSTSDEKNKTKVGTEDGHTSDIKDIVEKETAKSSSSLVFGYLNLFSDGVHNFTDGMALGSAFLLHGSIGGWSRTLFLLAHELPQEVGDFGILVRSGFSVSKALFFNFLSALVALAGTALALLWGKDPGHSSLLEGFTAGGFIYIAVAGVLAETNNGSSSALRSTVTHLTSLLLGMAVALFISLLE